MYSESDLQSAIKAGAISQSAADALRSHVSSVNATPHVDEEHFRLITGFNDIFVSIAAVILLVAMGWIGHSMNNALAGVFVAATAWGLAEYFTRQRHMALPSILLLLAFVGGVFGSMVGFLTEYGVLLFGAAIEHRLSAVLIAVIALITAGAAWLHWRRFMVPITIAAGAAAVAGTIVALIIAIIGDPAGMETILLMLMLAVGLALFAFAMRWDISDRSRETRRSDVAFWLHLLAAPLITHALFALIGVSDGGQIGAATAVGVVAVYIVLGLVAIAVDRRAMLVSALAYVLFALTFLFRQFGAVELNVALTALVIGSALLCLSAFWTPIRIKVVAMLPDSISTKLPLVGGGVATLQPAS